MPLHEYLCQTCDARFEALTSPAGADAVACPTCESDQTRRLISVIAGIGRGATTSSSPMGMGVPSGGCCGGSCGCGHR
jgi:putative FmdB family regulatory protein